MRQGLNRVIAVTAQAVDCGGLAAAAKLLVSVVSIVAVTVQGRQGDKTRVEEVAYDTRVSLKHCSWLTFCTVGLFFVGYRLVILVLPNDVFHVICKA